jgi:hypothetical protein
MLVDDLAYGFDLFCAIAAGCLALVIFLFFFNTFVCG